jgi:hypothetical protein
MMNSNLALIASVRKAGRCLYLNVGFGRMRGPWVLFAFFDPTLSACCRQGRIKNVLPVAHHCLLSLRNKNVSLNGTHHCRLCC